MVVNGFRSDPVTVAMIYLSIALGGALGATARYGVSGWVQSWSGSLFPWGTLAVNITGSLILGVLFHLGSDRFLISPEWRLFLTTGFCGGLTTFSTFSQETVALLESEQFFAAGGNALLNVALCLAATWLGLTLARLF